MTNSFKNLLGLIVLVICVHGSIQQQAQQQLQFWRNNDKLIKNWQPFTNNIGSNGIAGNSNNAPMIHQQAQQTINQQPQPTPMQYQQMNLENYVSIPSPSAAPVMTSPQFEPSTQQQNSGDHKSESKNYVYANGYPIIMNHPGPLPLPQPAVVVAPPPVPLPVPAPVPVGAYPIQQPVVSSQGDVIIENTIGGIPFDCRGRPTGHWRDGRFCDIFHACVHGYQRKTYACPIVGERTYFDEVTKRCEFVSRNPAGCATNVFLK